MGEAGLKAYVGALAALALALVATWAYAFGVPLGSRYVLGAAVFGVLLVLAELFPLRVTERSEISALDVGLVAAVVVLGPLWAALALLPSAVVVGKKDLLRTAYEASRHTVEIFMAGTVFSFAASPLLSSGSSVPTAPAVYATLAAATTLLLTNGVLDAALLRIKYGQPFAVTWGEFVRPYLASDAVNVLTAGIGVLALLVYGPVAAVVLVAGSVGSQALVLHSREQSRRNRDLEAEVSSLRRDLMEFGTVFGATVVEALGRKDGYSHRHAAATAVYAADLAHELKLDKTTVERVGMAGLLHNIGMIVLPEALLLSKDRFNSIAQEQIAAHPVHGEKTLAAVPEFKEMAGWIRWHHERMDGRGYPDKLKGPWIPLEARILAVSQAYAAMVLDGPRRPGMKPAKARHELVAGIDTEFDGLVLRAFLRLLDAETEGYRMADDHRFVLPGSRAARQDEGVARLVTGG